MRTLESALYATPIPPHPPPCTHLAVVIPCLVNVDPGLAKDLGEERACPEGGPNTCCSPVEANGLHNLVLLLTTVSGADERHGLGERLHGQELVHVEDGLLLLTNLDGQGVLSPFEVGRGTMISHIVGSWGRYRASCVEEPEGRFSIVRMKAS